MSSTRILLSAIFLWTLVSIHGAFASEDVTPETFDVAAANKTIDKISIQLSTQDLSIRSLSDAVVQLDVLKDQAQACVDEAQGEVSTIEEKIKTAPAQTKIPDAPAAKPQQNRIRQDIKFLERKRDQFLARVSDCRLFVLRSEELISAYQKTLEQLTATRLFQKSAPIWVLFYPQTYSDFDQLSWHQILHPTGIDQFQGLVFILLLVIITFSVIASMFVQSRLRLLARKVPKKQHALLSLITTLRHYLIPIFVWIAMSWYMFFVFSQAKDFPVTARLVYVLVLYYVILSLLRAMLFPPEPVEPVFALPKGSGKKCYKCTAHLLRYLLVGVVILILFVQDAFPENFVQGFRAVYASGLVVLIGYFFLQMLDMLFVQESFKQYLLKLLIILIGFVLISVEWAGYHQLSLFLLTRVILTVALLAMAMLMHKAVRSLIQYMDTLQIADHTLRYYLGLVPKQSLKEGVLILTTTYLILGCYFLLMLLEFWGIPLAFIQGLKNALVDGFPLAGLKVVPLNLAYAVITFSVVTLVGRLFSTHIVHQTPPETVRAEQVTVASFVTYLSWAIAFLVAMVVLGVNFTALAIIAGALSIGIGLGMQNIVNNFVAGLILLIEKPVRPGDRIVVKDTEGFVKKIGFRSTQVTTLWRSEMIIPNADMITSPVVNYMLQDKLWRIKCSVGVAYGSDIEKVKAVLFEVARQHKLVLQTRENKPAVLFREFSDSSLLFELWCVIQDVDKKFQVLSELNSAIDTLFRKNNIEIAFPQQDVHIRDLPSELVKEKSDFNKG